MSESDRTPDHQREQWLLNSALELPAADRAAFLDRECAPALRPRLERLLQLQESAADFLEAGAAPDIFGSLRPTEVTAGPTTEETRGWIGRYRLVEKLGDGGFGVVYLAEQREPFRRRVALKIIKLGMDTRQVIARFEAERQALALMDHPNIAKVFDAGTSETGRPYFVMELVRGIRITEYCDQNQMATDERLKLFVQVCHAVQHAHQKGVIHRDLKPSNILVTLHDGVPVPKVIDFGIAKATQQALTERTLVTQFHLFLGTPDYMSPEQAELSGLDIDTRSDIYSLGVLLYELLTGRTPFEAKQLLGAGLDEMRRVIRERDPARPSTRLQTMLGPDLHTTAQRRHTDPVKLIHILCGDLDWIVMKALEKDRTRRYETANGLAQDIRRHLSNEPVTARPPSISYRVQKFVRRNKLLAAAGAALLTMLVLGLIVSSWFAVVAGRASRDAHVAKDQAIIARNQAQQAEQVAVRNLYLASMNLVQQDYDEGNITRIRRVLDGTQSNPNRGFEWFYWQRRIHQDLKTIIANADPIRGVALSPDGRLLATACMDGPARLWDVGAGRELHTFPQLASRVVAFSQDGRRLAIGGSVIDPLNAGKEAAKFVIWDVAEHRELLVITNTSQTAVWSVAFSPKGTKLAMGHFETGHTNVPSGIVVDAATGRTLLELAGHTHALMCISFSPEGSKIMTAGFDGRVRIWSAETGQQLLEPFDAGAGAIWGAGFSPDGRWVVSAHWDGDARVWEVATGRLHRTLIGHSPLESAIFSTDGTQIYTAGWDKQIKVWDAATGAELAPLPKGHTDGVVGMAMSSDGRQLVTSTWNGEVKFWDVQNVDEPKTFNAAVQPEDNNSVFRYMGDIRGPRPFLSPDFQNGLILALDTNKNVWVWQFPSYSQRFVLKGHTHPITALAVSANHDRIATGDLGGAVQVWDAHDGRKLFSLPAHTNRISGIAFSPNNRLIVTANGDSTRIWDQSGNALPPRIATDATGDVAFSPDSSRIALATAKGVTIWRPDLADRHIHLPHPRPVVSVSWSADGAKLATTCLDAVARVWDLAGNKLLREFHGHTVAVWCAVLSSDGRRLVTGSIDRTAKVWDMASGWQLLSLNGHKNDVHSVAISSDGLRIVTGSDDQTVKIWEAASPDEIAKWQKQEVEAAQQFMRLRGKSEPPGAPPLTTPSAALEEK